VNSEEYRELNGATVASKWLIVVPAVAIGAVVAVAIGGAVVSAIGPHIAVAIVAESHTGAVPSTEEGRCTEAVDIRPVTAIPIISPVVTDTIPVVQSIAVVRSYRGGAVHRAGYRGGNRGGAARAGHRGGGRR
jgi:hypothetical protein